MGQAKHKSSYYRTLAAMHARQLREQKRTIAIQRALLRLYTGAQEAEPLVQQGNPFDPEGKYL